MRYLDTTYNPDMTSSSNSGPLTNREIADRERSIEEVPYAEESKAKTAKRRCPAERYFDPILDKDLIDAFPEAVNGGVTYVRKLSL